MKKLGSKKDILMALERHQTKEEVSKLSARLKELDEYFKDKCALGVTQCGDHLICIDKRTRESVDKILLKSELGDKANKFIKTSQFKVMTFKKAA